MAQAPKLSTQGKYSGKYVVKDLFPRNLISTGDDLFSMVETSPNGVDGIFDSKTEALEALKALNKPEAASRILISAFLEEKYYQSNNFKNLVTESLRRCPKNTSHKGLITVINDREILSDSQLFQKFQAFQAEKRKRNY